MINLIPNGAKRKIFTEYWVRVATVWVATLSVLLIIASVLLLPSYVLIKTQTTVYAEGADERLAEVAEYNTSVEKLILATRQAKLITNQQSSAKLSGVITLIDDINNNLVQIEGYDISRKDDSELNPVIITGRAPTREALANFRESLLNHREIETAVLPLANLARDRDITFSITITLKNSDDDII